MRRKSCLIIGDHPDGGVIVQCGHCGQDNYVMTLLDMVSVSYTANQYDKDDKANHFCINCDEGLFYPDGEEW